MGVITVMLVEDHVLLREGTRELLNCEEDIRVVAEAGDGQEAIRLAQLHHPDVTIMDITLPILNGLEATRAIKAADPKAVVLVLTAYDEDQYVFAFLGAGAAGYLLKDVSAADLVKAIRAVSAGEPVLHPAVARKVMNYFSRRNSAQVRSDRGTQSYAQLSARELQVLKLAAKGSTNQGIANSLTLSARTVQAHLTSVFTKLRVGSRTEAILVALREGWLSIEELT